MLSYIIYICKVFISVVKHIVGRVVMPLVHGGFSHQRSHLWCYLAVNFDEISKSEVCHELVLEMLTKTIVVSAF